MKSNESAETSGIEGKSILVTGGCGSIGSRLVERLLNEGPEVIRVLDNDEEALFELKRQFDESPTLRFLLGDIRNRDRVELALENIDVVFHTAALKHVELNEYNPFEAVQTNVEGTQNLIRAALQEEVSSFVTISTDKASNPISVMGATKLLAERLTIAANTYKGERDTRFGCVRFGNVLGSSGSVVPLFYDQIRTGGPVTVTNPEMTRFMLPIRSAADLILRAHRCMTSGETFVLKMPGVRIGTLAEAMVDRYAPTLGYEPSDIDIDVVGERPGERTHEKLISSDEVAYSRELEDMFVLLPQIDIRGYEGVNYADAETLDGEYRSVHAELLSKPEIVDLVEEYCTLGAESPAEPAPR